MYLTFLKVNDNILTKISMQTKVNLPLNKKPCARRGEWGIKIKREVEI